MGIRLSGLVSNMDTDAMVKELVKASSEKKNKLVKEQTKLGWKMDAWKGLNKKVDAFFSKTLMQLNTTGDYRKKATTIADSTLASVTGKVGAPNGSQTLAVKQLAKSGSLTGGKLGADVDLSTKLSDIPGVGLGLGAGDSAQLKVSSNGKEKTITLTGNSTVEDLVNKLNDAGVSANFDTINKRFFINAMNSGEAGDFTISAQNNNGLEMMKNLKLVTKDDILNNSEYKKWADLQGDTVAIAQLVAAEAAKRAEAIQNANKNLSDYNTKLSDEITAFRDKQAIYEATQEYQDAMNAASPSATPEDAMTFYNDKINKINTETKRLKELEDKFAADPASLTQAEQQEKTQLESNRDNGDWADLDKHVENRAIVRVNAEHNANINARTDVIDQNNLAIAENNTYYTNDPITGAAIQTQKLTDMVELEFLEKIDTAVKAIADANSMPAPGKDDAVFVAGQDAVILLNGAEFTSSTSTFNVNGMTITAISESEKTQTGTPPNVSTDYKTTLISTTDDVEGIYNMIKGAFKEYNDLMKEMDSLYGAPSSKGFEPLTNEEKDAMTDTEIAEWEKKIKDSLMRKDANLGDLISSMKMGMMSTYNINGKDLNLSSFGIETGGYFNSGDFEKGVYHIYGDPDDSVFAKETSKLRNAIATDPESTMQFFATLMNDAYKNLNEQMKSVKGYRSFGKVYDDKKMQSDYDAYKGKIKEQEKKLTKMEDKYYKQFSAMEVAMSKLNSQQSSLSSLLGG